LGRARQEIAKYTDVISSDALPVGLVKVSLNASFLLRIFPPINQFFYSRCHASDVIHHSRERDAKQIALHGGTHEGVPA
jgi:hypothetical protein